MATLLNDQDEFISALPMSDQSNRDLARKAIKSYRLKQSVGEQDPPPVGSIRRVFWSASRSENRGLIRRWFAGLFGSSR